MCTQNGMSGRPSSVVRALPLGSNTVDDVSLGTSLPKETHQRAVSGRPLGVRQRMAEQTLLLQPLCERPTSSPRHLSTEVEK